MCCSIYVHYVAPHTLVEHLLPTVYCLRLGWLCVLVEEKPIEQLQQLHVLPASAQIHLT
jgi:hypothetical protein